MNDQPEQPDRISLSPDGEQRRQAILQAALSVGHRRRQRRVAGRTVGVLVVGLVCGWAVWITRPPHQTVPVTASNDQQPARTMPVLPIAVERNDPQRTVQITRIATDETLLNHWRVPPTPVTWTRLDDNGLLAALSAEGRPAALVVREGRIILWTPSRPMRN